MVENKTTASYQEEEWVLELIESVQKVREGEEEV